MNRNSLLMTGFCIALCTISLSTSRAQVDGHEILEGLSVEPAEVVQLESGKILAFSDEAYESTSRELSADAMVLVESDLDAVLKMLRESSTLIPNKVMLDHAEILSESDFAGVSFDAFEFREVENLFGARPGKKFNLSDSEYATLRAQLKPYRKSDRASKTVAASDAMRALLLARYISYRNDGLNGIDSYKRSSRRQVDVGRELRLSTNTFKPFEPDFPEFVRVMEDFPAGSDCCEHYFRWLKVEIRKRPTFALAHTMIQKTDDFVLLTERHYYVSNTLNSMQITLAWIPYGEGTYMGLAMSASADILSSVLGRVLRPLGRNKAKDLVMEVMEDVRTELESDRDVTDDAH